LQFHFHTPSEHTIDGRSYPLEMHLVHADDQGRLAVLGVLFEVGEAHPGLAALAANLPAPHETTTVDGATINADALLPADLGYVRYDGSLTTPPCSEGVAWHVVQATQTVSAEQLAAFVERIPSSNRPTKEVGARTLARDST
jgi:carbonic anhydrase